MIEVNGWIFFNLFSFKIEPSPIFSFFKLLEICYHKKTTILYETVGTFCNKNSVPRSPKINVVKDSALGMNKRHVYTNIAWWGREGEDACLEHGYWIIHVILYTYTLIMNIMRINRACVPTSFVQDCIQLPKKIRYRNQRLSHKKKVRNRICMIFAGNIVWTLSFNIYVTWRKQNVLVHYIKQILICSK